MGAEHGPTWIDLGRSGQQLCGVRELRGLVDRPGDEQQVRAPCAGGERGVDRLERVGEASGPERRPRERREGPGVPALVQSSVAKRSAAAPSILTSA